LGNKPQEDQETIDEHCNVLIEFTVAIFTCSVVLVNVGENDDDEFGSL
jgi:hypothetical protein